MRPPDDLRGFEDVVFADAADWKVALCFFLTPGPAGGVSVQLDRIRCDLSAKRLSGETPGGVFA